MENDKLKELFKELEKFYVETEFGEKVFTFRENDLINMKKRYLV